MVHLIVFIAKSQFLWGNVSSFKICMSIGVSSITSSVKIRKYPFSGSFFNLILKLVGLTTFVKY